MNELELLSGHLHRLDEPVSERDAALFKHSERALKLRAVEEVNVLVARREHEGVTLRVDEGW